MASVAEAGIRAPSALLDPPVVRAIAAAMVIFATCYTCMFAFLIAHGVPLGFGLVSLTEIGLLSAAILLIVMSGIGDDDWPVIGFVYAMLTIALLVSIQNDRPMIETVRTVLIIGVFSLLGQRLSARVLDVTIAIVTAVVLAVLILEVTAVEAYVSVFQPSNFYEATRGMQTSEFNQTGLFNAASSFAGRFSFGLFNSHRTSSIFLEQVSNANYACVLALYVSSRWADVPRWLRWLCIVTIVGIVVTTNGRFASALMLTLFVGHFIFPRLPRSLLPMVAVGILTLVFGLYILFPDAIGDDFLGRFVHAGRSLAGLGLGYLLGGEAWMGLADRDAGYTYLIGTTSIVGMVVIWLFVTFYPRTDDASSRRLAWGLVVYFFGQLVVSSTSLLSIKTAGMLWLLVGFVRVHRGTAVVSAERTPVRSAPRQLRSAA